MELLPTIPSKSINLIYIDPPFNTGKVQKRNRITAKEDEEGSRLGFGGKRFSVSNDETSSLSYKDKFGDFEDFLMSRVKRATECLADNGSIFIHLDFREVHYIKVAMDKFLGRDHFMNEIVWAYDYGAKPKKYWPRKHDTILWYVKDPLSYTFNYNKIDRIPYMAPDLVGPEKAVIGKIPTDCWTMTIVPTNSKEKTGYPTQKPMRLLDRIIRVHTNPGDTVLDFFAGSGSTAEAARKNGCGFVMIDNNQAAIDVMNKRLNPVHEQ